MPTRDDVPTVTGAPGTFARSVLEHRHPAIVEQLRSQHPYGPWHLSRLDALLEEALTGVLALPALDEGRWPDGTAWSAWLRPHLGRSWFDVPFLLAESWFHRRLLDAVGYVEPGPWQGVDPFAGLKLAELAGSAPMPAATTRDALVLASVWGNQGDLGFRLVAGEDVGRHDDLVADDTVRLGELLDAGSLDVAWVCDNAGRELVADLLLVDRLLVDGSAAAVTLHVKPRPHFVSDATTRDVADCLRVLAPEVSARLRAAAAAGRLALAADDFWCAPLELRDAPPALAGQLAAADLVVLKGDLNYRRLVGDADWPASTPFADAVQLPGRVAVLRTLKSDVLVGVPLAPVLDAGTPGWRSAGSRATVQVRG